MARKQAKRQTMKEGSKEGSKEEKSNLIDLEWNIAFIFEIVFSHFEYSSLF